jgi:GT2 family glycosyltransferase
MSLTTGIVIIGRNEGLRLHESLSSALATGSPLLYVDSGSTDQSLSIAAELGIEVLALSSDRPFSAPRGRNEGFLQLLTQYPGLDTILFLDGDCTIDDHVIPAGVKALESDKNLALVCSPVRELDRDHNIWKLLCDLEWNQPAGPIWECGGIFLIRVEAYRDIGGMDARLKAGEEPEMCLLLAHKGWKLIRIAEGLVLHDIGEFGFRHWWTRSQRSGLADLLGSLREGFGTDRHYFRKTLRPWLWGVVLPFATVLLFLRDPLWATLLMVYPLLFLRMTLRLHQQGRSWRESMVFSIFNLLGRWPEVAGQVRLLLAILSGSAPSPHGLRDSPIVRNLALPCTRHDYSARIGVVVIGRNEGDRLLDCLHSVTSDSRTVVYVDSGSTDNSVELAKSASVEVVDLDMSMPFTAARARNAGFRALLAIEPDIELVQFVDGDCSVHPDWIGSAAEFLHSRPEVVAVSGRRREQHPEVSIYNRLADLEWNSPVGPIKYFGGDTLLRVNALREVNGYNEKLIGCEEPELCFRLRLLGWKILRIDFEMTEHDARITHFSQWWKRSTRTGYSYIQSSVLHPDKPIPFMQREIRSALIWGGAFPILLLSCFFNPMLLIVVGLGFLWQVKRILNRNNLKDQDRTFTLRFALFSVLINLPIAVGMLRYVIYSRMGRQNTLIEYR